MQRLDIAAFPLTGTRLIEASAGTGKTFTLTALYLRLLLEKSRDVSELLVVTFTEAATDELRGRVRARLREAAAAFEAGQADDPILADLLARLADHPARAQQLRDAVTRLDEAAIFTIHGFCQRMLSEHAFESGALFDTELTTDERTLQETVINDFWRLRFYDGDRALAAWVTRRWASPGDLLEALAPWMRNRAPRVLPPADPKRLEDAHARVAQSFDSARAAWRTARETIIGLLDDAVAQKVLSRAKKGGYPPEWIAELAAIADAYFENHEPPGFAPPDLAAFMPTALAGAHNKSAAKKGLTPPDHPFFEEIATLLARVAELDVLREARLLIEAADYLRTGLEQRKRETRQWTFNDLLVDLDDALRAPGGPALANRIRERFPAALVDEFQDTDPLQYRIFDTIYGQADDAGAWYMIGDPKQAIYGFRGADIFTYIQARRDTDPGSQHFTLDTNWRSAERLVTAVNALFDQADAPFIFDEDIQFHPARAAGRADAAPLILGGEAPSALQVWFVERATDNTYQGTITKGWAHANLAAACAAEIVQLLQMGREGSARIGERAVRAGDVAVLVRDRYDADAMRAAFAGVGIKSVYMSRDSVFETPEAEALEHVLAAVAEPGVERRLRAALATDLVGADAQALAAGEHDPRWLDWLTRFQAYHELWAADGFMPFFQRFLRDQAVPARLLAQIEGERRLTNLLQLGELAQAASEIVWGMEGLLRWLGEHRRQPNGDAEDQQLRLESDAGLVKIVTIHKSKGLEYPIVFLPFIWGSRPRKDRAGGRSAAVDFHAPADRLYTLDLGTEQHAAHHALSDSERLAEDLRLLYVALTRASHRCYLAWGQFYGAADSALGYLLHPGGDKLHGSQMRNLDDATLRAAWEHLAEATDGAIEVTDLPNADGTPAPAFGVAPERLSARPFTARVPRGWRVASYSALISGREVAPDTPFAPPVAAELPDHDAVDASPVDPVSPVESAKPFSSLFQFPRGARAGTFMHALLERLDFQTGAGTDGTPLATLTERMLRRHGFDVRWRGVIMAMVENVLDTSLGEGGRLRDVGLQSRLVEMEFYFPLGAVSHDALNRFLADYRGGDDGARLAFGAMSGLMKGFVDLIFEREGRFFIVDYKSNHLGESTDDYVPARLAPAIVEHYYDLQYLIYTVALHRYLAHRINDYDYERHVGGVYYLFLRGMDARRAASTGVYFERPAHAQVEALDRLLAGGGS